ncbi:hypothetical protein HBH82_016570 [Parastagonospora nodorum]|nr:hypothetical protein HBH82_016570 [Parastagonospora nodorum]KAH4713274.1 hypothetical protein HBH67_004580 [Parastagonospora nodorum]KAH4728650.1 hypothetical protein HBH78_018480 [Parastagonospora nodorum]KAH4792583.1 hypothetical protein HBH62_019770 [Parastagonospora nodorum]KAH4830713.1 hypothetical protein HBH63_032420 [Parastagonospora nodorum]
MHMAGDAAGAAQAAHCLIFTLPDELLLDIAHCLSTPDQCELSLVSKQIGTIAQEALYCAPSIPYRSSPPSRIAMLAEVLARNAHLACKVQELDLKPHTRHVSVETTLFHPWDDTVAESMQHLTVFMKESKIVGYILKHVPNLRHLLLDVRDEEAASFSSDRTHEHLLGYDHGQEPYGGAAMSNVVVL